MVEYTKGDRKLAMDRIDSMRNPNGKIKGMGREVSMGTMMMYVSAVFVVVIALGFGAAYGVMWVAGDSLA